jgi:hypothetical protein
MTSRKFALFSLASLAGGAMLALSMSPASAFTLDSPSISQPFASAQVDKVWWHHRWHHRHCWINRWGHRRCHWW